MVDDASREYGNQVSAILAAQPRNSTWKPDEPMELFVKNRRQPTSTAALSDIEREQLKRIAAPNDPEAILAGEPIDDFPLDVEVADVVDDKGALRYRLWAGNYGWAYLMAADSLECLAFTAQHDMEHWRAEQRPLFWAMDRALQRGDHGVQQGLKFCWWDDKCWSDMKPLSEPYVRQQFAGEN